MGIAVGYSNYIYTSFKDILRREFVLVYINKVISRVKIERFGRERLPC